MLENLFFLIFIFLYSIKCMDIRLSLGEKFQDRNTYPVIITLKEPLIYETNEIDLFCVFDCSGSMNVNKTNHLKSALNLIIEALNENDRLSLISFGFMSNTRLKLLEMTDSNKKKST